MQHIIKKQVIELKLSGKLNAFRMQHLISEHYRNQMVPVLEAAFNEYCGEDEVLLLDKLEVDFGIIHQADFEKIRLDEGLLLKFKSKLLESLAVFSANKKIQYQSKFQSICRQWMFYMQHGYLNWNTLQVDRQWYKAVLETLAIDYAAVGLLREMISQHAQVAHRIVWQHEGSFLTTLVEILTAKNQTLLGKAIEEVAMAINFTQQQAESILSTADFNKELWQKILLITAKEPRSFSTGDIITILLHDYAVRLPVKVSEQVKVLAMLNTINNSLIPVFEMQAKGVEKKKLTDAGPKEKISEEDIYETNPKQKSVLKEEENENAGNVKNMAGGDVEKGDQSKVNSNSKKEAIEDTSKNKGNSKERSKQKDKKSITGNKYEALSNEVKISDVAAKDIVQSSHLTESEIKDLLFEKNEASSRQNINRFSLSEVIPAEGIFIQHAGLVLAHPFLGSLFRRLEWIKDNQFIDAEAQLKAVFMLHYLTTGKAKAEEYQLVLCKLLCAYLSGETTPAEMIFTKEQLVEAEDMLTAMIQQWSKLQNTSIAGLREIFLQRGGKLFIKNNMPYLQVENSAIDVLLDYLPWNLSMVKLPWMKEILWVEWR